MNFFLSTLQLFTLASIIVSVQSGLPFRGRIVGGYDSNRGAHPWFASLWDNNSKQVRCGATLINPLHLVTAAHCVENVIDGLSIVLSMYETGDVFSLKMLPIAEIIIPKDYEPSKSKYKADIAIVKLMQPVAFDDDVRPVCLPNKPIDLTNETLLTVGFGKLGRFSAWPEKLQELQLSYHESDCSFLFGKGFLKDHICARDSQAIDEKDVCLGDSGGPLLLKKDSNFILVGITSHGNCVGSPAAIFTRVSHYLGWILSNAKDLKFCDLI